MTTGKTIALTRWTFVGKVISLLFNITSWQIDGETMETVTLYFGGAPKPLQMVTAAMKLKDAYSLEGKL